MMMALHSVQPMTLGGAPPLGDQRRRTIPRGAQFCSIYLQNHINKCCRIVQLLKSKAARWGGGCKRMTDHCRNGDAISKLQPGNHCIWEGAGGWRAWHIFCFPLTLQMLYIGFSMIWILTAEELKSLSFSAHNKTHHPSAVAYWNLVFCAQTMRFHSK